MENNIKVSVFESDKPSEIQLIKSKLEEQNIVSEIGDNYMTFTTTPTATSLKLMVNITDEQRAFDIIDAYLQEK